MTEQANNKKKIEKFFLQWEASFDDMCNGFVQLMTEECLWKQAGIPDIRGARNAIAFLKQFREGYGLETARVEILNLLADGNFVISERIDHLRRADGSLMASIPAVGVMEFTEGKITGWREYFDSAAMAPIMAATGPKA